MAVWPFYLSLCLLLTLSASEEMLPQQVGNRRCGACRAGWSAFRCRCFKFFSNSQMWINAEKTCQDFNGHLASIHSHEEYVFIQNLIRYTTNGATRAWIGANDAVHEGVWLWSDGSKFNYQIWSPGEPNDDKNEDCLEMNYTNGNWNDLKCYYKMPFVCVN
ncbi:galactose-specific lectin nattectin-like [Carassius auratus]|uniref:Galactose-specific lectin nattectin-like n=1 Tax=Carassius auratus TaxID=7957 RepID=A0A6P6N5D5_CARAU|nr:galactose-specific lectin nattectin-like [Carassius auratus]XP_026136516.1 galactose-specific lectin nattectin-like [Carassius auratus]XP_052446935.1 galactose-specific lectin nattectin [Carassius gibelio]